MSTLIQQIIRFNGAGPDDLFDTYLDPIRHAEVIGAPVTISAEPGSAFSAFGGEHVRGKTLHVLQKQMIVQTWRGTSWRQSDPDSILIITFSKTSDGANIELVQTPVPDHTRDMIHSGWHKCVSF